MLNNQIYLANMLFAQSSSTPHNVQDALYSSNRQHKTTKALGTPPDQKPQSANDEDDFDLSAYMRRITHVNLIQDNELFSCDSGAEAAHGPGTHATVPPQSIIDDLEDQ